LPRSEDAGADDPKVALVILLDNPLFFKSPQDRLPDPNGNFCSIEKDKVYQRVPEAYGEDDALLLSSPDVLANTNRIFYKFLKLFCYNFALKLSHL